MRRERLGVKSDEGLIVKSPETEIVAKVELQNNGTAVASLMKWDEVIELDEQANEEKSSSKKKLIAGMILFYLAITGIFICISGVVVGTIVGLYFVTMTIMQFYFLLPQMFYGMKHKEEVQYANIFRKADVCHSKGICINKENILSVKPSYEDFINKDNINKIGLSLIGIIFTPLMLIIPYINTITLVIIDVGILIILVWSMKNKRFMELSRKINELLVYRKPTDEQIDIVLFGFRYLEKCEETLPLMKWFYWH